MYRFRLSILIMLIGIAISNCVFASAYQVYELGTPIIGTAAVGQAANTYDASTAYFNPAGMGFLPGINYMLGAQVMVPKIYFSHNASNTIAGDNGGDAGLLTPGMDIYFTYRYSPCLAFGVSLTSPYGGSLTYDDGWVGRFIVQQALFYTINLNPSMAYRFNHCLSVGAGVSLEYMNLQQTTAFPIDTTGITLADGILVDGQINIKTANYAPGFNLGVMFSPNDATKIGIAYRSQITHKLHGNLTFLRIPFTPDTSTKMITPQNIIASFSEDFCNGFTLLAEAGWSNWSAMKNLILTVHDVSAVTPLDWHDTYRVGLGGRFHAMHDLVLQAGVSYDSSPTSTSHRLPVLPMDRQIRFGTGLIYTTMKCVDIAFSYEYWNLGKARIHNTSFNGVLAGSYSQNFANTVQASVNVSI